MNDASRRTGNAGNPRYGGRRDRRTGILYVANARRKKERRGNNRIGASRQTDS